MLRLIIALEVAALVVAGRAYVAQRVGAGASSASLAAEGAGADRGTSDVAGHRSASREGPDAKLLNAPLPALRAPSLLIEKSAGRLTVFDGGRAVKKYRVIGGAGRGDKTREGDRCTPEGDLYVCVRTPHSRFTRALGLSYPGIADAERGLRAGAISRGEYTQIVRQIDRRSRPPWKTALGGEIMVHGKAEGRDATLGCVAMSDSDIRELYPAIPLGTPVRIVP